MYLDYVVDIPDVKGKITFRTKGQAGYVYYEYSREYDPSKQYTNVKRVTIGKALLDDRNKMRPNENFRKYFPEVDKRSRGRIFWISGMRTDVNASVFIYHMIQQIRTVRLEI